MLRTARAHDTALAENVLIGLGLVVLFFLLPHHLAGDDVARFQDVEQLRAHGSLSGSRYSIIVPAISLPVVALGTLVQSPEWWATRFNVIAFGIGAVLVLRLLRDRVDGHVLRRCVLVLMFSSMLTYHLRTYNTEVASAVLVTVGLALLATRRPKRGWALIVVAVANVPGTLGALVLIAAAETLRTRRLRFLTPIAAAGALIMAEAWLRRGGPFTSGYEGDPGFTHSLVLGTVVILFSFGRGLLFFAPGLFLWLSARTRGLARDCAWSVVLMLLYVTGLVIVYAKWWAWYGGVAWGPRFFLFAAVPASLAIALRLGRESRSAAADAATLLVLAVSAWVASCGALADWDHAEPPACTDHGYALEYLCWYHPDYSSLWQPIVALHPVSAATALVVAYTGVVLAYLAWPLVANVARSCGGLAARTFRPTEWRF